MRQLMVLLGALTCLAGSAVAGPITYNVVVNSSTLNGTTGSLDFNFNPGPLATQAASLQILNFTSDGSTVGSASVVGDASGTLPATLTFDNGTAFNDYFQSFKFGTNLSFGVSLFGPALSAPDGLSSSGSSFAFSMFSNAAGTIPALTTDKVNGFAYVVNVNLDGSTTATSFLPGVSGVPEPGTWALSAALFAVLAAVRMKGGRIRVRT